MSEAKKGNLVIVESPAKAKTIQRFLGKDYVVKPSFGHIRDLQDKKLSVDIDHGFSPEYVIPDDKKKVVADLKKLAGKAETVWLASDEDREGEAISWHLAETLGLDKDQTRRIVFHEITKDAILNAIQSPRTIDMNLVNAQQARRVLDRLVGFELSPILWKKVQPKLSAGRVQSVALRLVVDREKEIMAFKNEPYYSTSVIFHPKGAPSALKVSASLDTRFNGEKEARKYLEDSIGDTFSVTAMDRKESTRTPAPPFTTSTLQQEAARKLHFPVSLTMRIAQQLYEKGHITYMRTDSTNLSKLALGSSKRFISDNFGEEYSTTRQYRTRSRGAQEAHEAIRPTFIDNTDIEGTLQEKKLYSLIWKRTIASQMADARVMNTAIKVGSTRRGEKFQVSSSQILFDGFLKIYIEGTDDQDQDIKETILPNINIGDVMEVREMKSEGKFTQAPPRYSEATLVRKLEELGIGRPSTYAPIISTLTTGRGYIARGDKEGRKFPVRDLVLKGEEITETDRMEIVGSERGKLLPQEVGIVVTDFLMKYFGPVIDYDFTANVEKDFDKIADGDLGWNSVISDFYTPFHAKVEETLAESNFARVSRELGTDSEGNVITAKFGQYGPYVQKGEGENRQFAQLGRDQLIENITLEEALKLFELPRTVGQYEGTDIVATKGRFGPYLKFGDTNVSLSKGMNPFTVTLQECIDLIESHRNQTPVNSSIAEFAGSGISVLNGRYGPYIKQNGSNFKIPKGTDARTLTEEDCKKIIESSKPTKKHYRKFKK